MQSGIGITLPDSIVINTQKKFYGGEPDPVTYSLFIPSGSDSLITSDTETFKVEEI